MPPSIFVLHPFITLLLLCLIDIIATYVQLPQTYIQLPQTWRLAECAKNNENVLLFSSLWRWTLRRQWRSSSDFYTSSLPCKHSLTAPLSHLNSAPARPDSGSKVSSGLRHLTTWSGPLRNYTGNDRETEKVNTKVTWANLPTFRFIYQWRHIKISTLTSYNVFLIFFSYVVCCISPTTTCCKGELHV